MVRHIYIYIYIYMSLGFKWLMCKNMAQTDRIPNATNTHSQYVILIAFPLQQWLNERASMLRYK